MSDFWTAGQDLTAEVLNIVPRGRIANHIRTGSSVSGVGATETGFIRIDGIPVRDGYSYEVCCPRCVCSTTAFATTSSVIRLRGSVTGAATITSPQLDGGEMRPSFATDNANTPELPIIGYYDATADGTLSVILTVTRTVGAGTVGLFAGSLRIPLTVSEVGFTPADSGVDL